jgi:hypothetical protein
MAGAETNLVARLRPQFSNQAADAAGSDDCDLYIGRLLLRVYILLVRGSCPKSKRCEGASAEETALAPPSDALSPRTRHQFQFLQSCLDFGRVRVPECSQSR